MTSKDTKALQSLILWLRKERISYQHLSAGGFTLDGVVDLKAVDEAKATPEEPRPTVYQRYGGDLLKQPTVKKGDAVPDEAMIDG
jgi:hypothetical protein